MEPLMEPSKTWVLLVDHDFQALFGNPFSVLTSGKDDVCDLKDKVKEENPDALDYANADASDLTVWKTKGAMVINKSSSQLLVEILGRINVNDEDTIEELSVYEQVANLQLSDGQILLVRLPAIMLKDQLFVHPMMSEVGRDSVVQDLIIQAKTRGFFTEDDVEDNDIVDAGKVPEFVKKYEKVLSQKRKVADNICTSAKAFVSEATFEKYFGLSTADFSQHIPTADWHEVSHLIHISSIDEAKSWDILNGLNGGFKEVDASWLFFYPIMHYLVSPISNIEGDVLEITAQLGKEWFFRLIIQVGAGYFIHKPRSYFLILNSGLPRVAVSVEVKSNLPETHVQDQHHLMVQGASIVRFANSFLDAYKEKKNFVFVAIFIYNAGLADRYLLFQREGSREVYHKKQSFHLSREDGRIRFARELYNLVSALDNESKTEDTEERVKDLREHVMQLEWKYNLPMFTTNTKHSPSDDGGNQCGPSVLKGSSGGAIEQLKACGYEVVPDVLETKGGTWELINKLPPHILTVYRQSDPKKTELIAKQVRKGSDELGILKYLHTIQPPSPHIISLTEAIPSITGGWLILPKMHSIHDQAYTNNGGISHCVKLGWGLIKGLAYLHEHKIAHRDIKPDNLVYDNTFHLKIIDFDIAIKVEDENTQVDDQLGTKDWMAPEMREQEGLIPMYSPIKADRWSCGRVLLCHIMVGKGDNRLSQFAHQLMANNPQRRPSLLEWHKWSAGPFSHKDGGKVSQPQQDMVEVDGESMEPPVAKKPRLAVTE